MFAGAFGGKTVWLSGHTGFKGAWLAQWLLEMGARVHGFSLSPTTPPEPTFFDQLGLAGRVEHQIADVRDPAAVAKSIAAAQPDFVFHLAAQAILRASYELPLETYATNVMGTVHVLEALRGSKKPCTAVLVTTDKCYENREWVYGYREEDPLGGYDPYSSSKAAAEIAISAWRRSFFGSHPVRIASARAGNVIGGGDWAKDRIVPDCIRQLQRNEPISVRNPKATRPWQHVLEPLSGYLWLAARLAGFGVPALAGNAPENANLQPAKAGTPNPLASAFNFGPGHDSNRNVEALVTEVLKQWPGRWEDRSDPDAVHEARLLQLATDKASALLGWAPVWDFATTIEQTVKWYRETAKNPHTAPALTSRQIADYHAAAAAAGLSWAL
jgi:CDP-glucose 4,6-dehydratase